MARERNQTLDLMRLAAAFAVVCIHFRFPGVFGEAVIALARFAVPFFFIVTGLYLFRGERVAVAARLRARVKSTLLLILISNGVYLCFRLIVGTLLDGKTALEVLSGIFTPQSVIALLVFNESPVFMHLWYLNAMLGLLLAALLCHRLLPRVTRSKALYAAVPALLTLLVLFGKYSKTVMGFQISGFQPYYLRNALFTGLPCLLLGKLIGENESAVAHIGKAALCAAPPLLALCTLGEFFLTKYLLPAGVGSVYISTVPLAASLVLLALRYPQNNMKQLSRLGGSCSLMIYIVHPMFGQLLRAAISGSQSVVLRSTVAPAAFAASLCFAVLHDKWRGRLRKPSA